MNEGFGYCHKKTAQQNPGFHDPDRVQLCPEKNSETFFALHHAISESPHPCSYTRVPHGFRCPRAPARL